MSSIEEIDVMLDVVSKRTSFFLKDEVVEFMGEEWVEANPPFNDIYSLRTVTDAALDMRIEAMNEAAISLLEEQVTDETQEEECTPIEVGSQ